MNTVTVDENVRKCTCCSKSHMKKTLRISIEGHPVLHMGVTCAGQWFGTNLSGNIFLSATRLEKHIKNFSKLRLEEILVDIAESGHHADRKSNKGIWIDDLPS